MYSKCKYFTLMAESAPAVKSIEALGNALMALMRMPSCACTQQRAVHVSGSSEYRQPVASPPKSSARFTGPTHKKPVVLPLSHKITIPKK